MWSSEDGAIAYNDGELLIEAWQGGKSGWNLVIQLGEVRSFYWCDNPQVAARIIVGIGDGDGPKSLAKRFYSRMEHEHDQYWVSDDGDITIACDWRTSSYHVEVILRNGEDAIWGAEEFLHLADMRNWLRDTLPNNIADVDEYVSSIKF